MSGAAAQYKGSKFHPNFQNTGHTTWVPRLHVSHPSFHHFTLPTDHMRGTDTQWYESAQQNNGSNTCDVYQQIFQDESCYQILQMGGAFLSSRVCNRSTADPNYVACDANIDSYFQMMKTPVRTMLLNHIPNTGEWCPQVASTWE